MSLETSVLAQVSSALTDHGQIGILRRRFETFDPDAGGWVEDSPPVDTVLYFAPEEFSDVLKAGGALIGDRLVYIPANAIGFVPYVGSSKQKHLEFYFGVWAAVADATVATATSSGTIVEVGQEARYKSTQMLWTLTVKTSG